MRTVTLPNEEMLPEVAKMLSEGNCVKLKAKGNSMLPFIVGGRDEVMIEKREEYNKGDIVLAEVAPQRFVLHRIIRMEREGMVLMGDGNLWGTEQCRKESVYGRVTGIVYQGQIRDCNRKSERWKAEVWQFLLPIRRYLLAIYRRL